MKRSRYSDEQIVYAIRQAESCTLIGDLCRHLGIGEATFYAWKQKYAHLGVSELRRPLLIEEENTRLKRLVADLSLDKLTKPVVSKASCGRIGARGCVKETAD